MTTDSKDRPTTSKSGMPSWLKRVIMFAILGAVLVIVYFILAAFLPRWWAERIGELSDRGFARGITWGLLFGGLCTLVPLLQVLLAVLFRHKRGAVAPEHDAERHQIRQRGQERQKGRDAGDDPPAALVPKQDGR